jgi:glycosyltransferase involved in cell wall biosynthesis
MGAHATLVPDVPVIYPSVERFTKPEATVVAAVCSFNYDEPIAEILDAARAVPEVRFFMTGNPKHLSQELKARMPANVTLTGFLSVEAYGGLVSGADAVMTLTTRDHTMLRAAYEAIYQGTPVIVSDWDLLRGAFDEGALHVDNSVEQIATAVRRVAVDGVALREGARRLKERKLRRWAQTKEAIAERIGVALTVPPAAAARKRKAVPL